MLEGIDVSEWQPEVDYATVRKSGMSFLIAKASEGFRLDEEYHQHRRGAKENQLVFGAYHFARPASRFTAEQQAHLFLAYALLEPGDFRPVLDIEDPGHLDAPNLVSWCLDFVAQVRLETGHVPIIYSSPAFWREHMDNTKLLRGQGCPLWVAHYGVTEPTLFGGWDRWRIWQRSDTGTCSGIEGHVDLNRAPSFDYIVP